MQQASLEKWHAMLASGNPAELPSILADDVVFYSPVVFSPQKGKKITAMYLMGAFQVLVAGGHFEYVNKTYNDSSAVLEFQTKVDDVIVNGVDIIHFDEKGLIKEFKVMVRPLQGMQKLQEKMAILLQQMQGK